MCQKYMESKLIKAAKGAMQNSYSKYSEFKVGAAVLGDNDKIYVGTNIENVSYGLSMCAERTAIFAAISDGVRYIKALSVIGDSDDLVSPCGACRQVLLEFADDSTNVIFANRFCEYEVKNVADLIPFAFKKI